LTGTGKDFDFGNTVDIHAHQPKQSTQHTTQQHKTSHLTSGNTGNKPGKSFSAPQNSKVFGWSLNLTYATFIVSPCILCKMSNGLRTSWLDISHRSRVCRASTPIFDGYRLPLEPRIAQSFLWAFSHFGFQQTARGNISPRTRVAKNLKGTNTASCVLSLPKSGSWMRFRRSPWVPQIPK